MEAYLKEFPRLVPYAPYALMLGLCAASWSFFYVCRAYLLRLVTFLMKNVPGMWAQTCLDARFLAQLSWMLPVLLVWGGTPLIEGLPATLVVLVERLSQATLVVLLLRAITIFLWNVNTAYTQLPVSRDRPIKGFIQVTLLLLHLLALILVVSILVDKSPWVFLSGLGAMTAVLLLVFRDTLLSLVAGFQLTSNNLIRVGDWIEMPQFGADGDVVDIALHAVRVQNWDKTITVIPTHKFLEHSFKNWRGMHESGGRRIKRAVHIDQTSIRFLTEAEIERFGKFVLLRDYIARKKKELQEHNAAFAHDPELIVNARRLTNIGTFRAYLANYLRQNPRINPDMTFLVRQLPPGPEGLPIEIYVFTRDTRWAVYEGIQADIFDHVLAIVQEFGLKVFQNPSGHDFRETLRAAAD